MLLVVYHPPSTKPLDYLMRCATASQAAVDVWSLVRDRKRDCTHVSVNLLHTVTEIIIQFVQTLQTVGIILCQKYKVRKLALGLKIIHWTNNSFLLNMRIMIFFNCEKTTINLPSC